MYVEKEDVEDVDVEKVNVEATEDVKECSGDEGV